MNLAIFKTNHLGDNVVFLPVVQTLRRLRPTWRITLLTAPQVAELYQAAIAPENLLTVDPEHLKRAWRRPWELLGWTQRLRTRRFDACLVSYDQSSVAHALARITGGRTRVGAAGLRIRLRGTLTHEIARAADWSVAKWNWETARALVAHIDGAADWPAEPPPPDLAHLAHATMRQPRRIVVHAGSKSPMTRWPRAQFAALATRLARDHEVRWIDAPEIPGPLPAGTQACPSRTLGELVQVVAGASLLIGNNSGPMHIATAVGTPGVIISGPSARVWDPTWHAEKFQLLRTPGLACLPCDRALRAAPTCQNTVEPFACMHRWSVEAVEAACRRALAT
jgi:ADP-heptose:LPS heptosyltransferase